MADSMYDRLMRVVGYAVDLKPGELRVARDQRVVRSLIEELRTPTDFMVESGGVYGDPDDLYREEDKGEVASAVWDAMMNQCQNDVDAGIELDGYTAGDGWMTK